jgi:hypothetical protein
MYLSFILKYLLSWRGFHGNMCKGFHNLQRDGQMVDVTIAAGGRIFKAHKLVSIQNPTHQLKADVNKFSPFPHPARYYRCAVHIFKKSSWNIHHNIQFYL